MKAQMLFGIMMILLLAPREVGAFKQTYREKYLYDTAAKDSTSFSMTEDNALNLCPCDVTRGSCDAYCCCDEADCDADVLAFWKESYNTYCEANAINKQYKSKESACIDQTLLKKSNAVDGMSVTERDGQACVTLNIPSAFSEYKPKVDADSYIKEQAALNPDHLALMTAQETYNSRKTSTYTAFYKHGDQIMNQTEQKVVTRARSSPQTFFLTQAVGFNGYCSNNIGVSFMKDVDHDNSCTQVITDLKTAAETHLDFRTYYSADFDSIATRWGVASGIGTTRAVEVTLGEVWKLDDSGILTRLKKESESVPASPSWATKFVPQVGNAGPCSVDYALKEAYYEVRYKPVIDARKNSELFGFQIVSTKVDVVLQEKLTLTGSDQEKYCDPDLSSVNALDILSGYRLTQTFGIKFKPWINTTMAKDEFYRSGSPGYQTEMPVIIGQQSDIAKPQIVAKEGTRFYSENEQGECYQAINDPAKSENLRGKVLQFEQQTQLTCKVKKNRADLQKYCEGSDKDAFTKLKIFKQLSEKLQYVSQFGSPSLTKQKDWVKFIVASQIANGYAGYTSKQWEGVKKWDEATSTCSGVIGYDVKFLYSSLGFKNQLQKYIVGAQIEEIRGDWTYFNMDGDPASTQSYIHMVQMWFQEVLHEEQLKGPEDTVSWLFPKIPQDIFYPFIMDV